MNGNFNHIINDNKPVLVDFSANWCSPCKMMGPVLEQLKSSMGDKIRILKVDVDNNSELASRYNIRSVPSLILFQSGIKKWSGAGVMTSDYLEKIILNNSSVEKS